jgi:ubiquinone biosynthesis protein
MRSISPDLDFVAAAREEGQLVVTGRMQPEAVRQSLEDQLVTMLPVLQRLPRRINNIAENLEYGRTVFTVRVLADERDRSFLTGIVQQVTMTILASACAISGILLVTSEAGPLMLPQLRLYTFFGATLFFFGFVLGARSLVLIFRRSQT